MGIETRPLNPQNKGRLYIQNSEFSHYYYYTSTIIVLIHISSVLYCIALHYIVLYCIIAMKSTFVDFTLYKINYY